MVSFKKNKTCFPESEISCENGLRPFQVRSHSKDDLMITTFHLKCQDLYVSGKGLSN